MSRCVDDQFDFAFTGQAKMTRNLKCKAMRGQLSREEPCPRTVVTHDRQHSVTEICRHSRREQLSSRQRTIAVIDWPSLTRT